MYTNYTVNNTSVQAGMIRFRTWCPAILENHLRTQHILFLSSVWRSGVDCDAMLAHHVARIGIQRKLAMQPSSSLNGASPLVL